MKAMLAFFALALAAAGHTPAPAAASQPADRPTSLSPEEVASLLAGEGMGLAHVAEHNHYPGPRHVLAVADEIGLSTEQRTALGRIKGETIDHAREAGRKIVDKEAELSEAFVRGEITEARLRSLVAEIADLQGQLRFVHLAAHLASKKLLSAAQIEKYEKLRGYTEH
jgi:Spy/CpxP family protein refolding chaperone